MKAASQFSKEATICSVGVQKIVMISAWAEATGFDLVSVSRETLHCYTVRGFVGKKLIDVSMKVVTGVEEIERFLVSDVA